MLNSPRPDRCGHLNVVQAAECGDVKDFFWYLSPASYHGNWLQVSDKFLERDTVDSHFLSPLGENFQHSVCLGGLFEAVLAATCMSCLKYAGSEIYNDSSFWQRSYCICTVLRFQLVWSLCLMNTFYTDLSLTSQTPLTCRWISRHKLIMLCLIPQSFTADHRVSTDTKFIRLSFGEMSINLCTGHAWIYFHLVEWCSHTNHYCQGVIFPNTCTGRKYRAEYFLQGSAEWRSCENLQGGVAAEPKSWKDQSRTPVLFYWQQSFKGFRVRDLDINTHTVA